MANSRRLATLTKRPNNAPPTSKVEAASHTYTALLPCGDDREQSYAKEKPSDIRAQVCATDIADCLKPALAGQRLDSEPVLRR